VVAVVAVVTPVVAFEVEVVADVVDATLVVVTAVDVALPPPAASVDEGSDPPLEAALPPGPSEIGTLVAHAASVRTTETVGIARNAFIGPPRN